MLLSSFLLISCCSIAAAAFEPPSVFPASMRQALADKAKAINPSDSSSDSEPYSAAGWSNRAASVLTPVAIGGKDDFDSSSGSVYTGDRPFYWNNIDVSCRMTVVELPSTSTSGSSNKPDLWVHSPVAPDGPMIAAIAKLGTVKHVVSPNYEHLKFAPAWAQAFPDANFWGCPGLSEKLPDIPWMGEVPDGYRPPGFKTAAAAASAPIMSADLPWWDTNVIQALHVDIETNPATGKPFFNEVIYFHTVTKTLIVTDVWWNYPASVVPNSQYGRNDAWELAPIVDTIPIGSKLWKVGMDKVYAPFYNAFMVKDKSAYKDIAHHIVNVWEPEIVIPAHGDVIRGKDFVKSVLSDFFGL